LGLGFILSPGSALGVGRSGMAAMALMRVVNVARAVGRDLFPFRSESELEKVVHCWRVVILECIGL
jgi:hypothetical protein